MSKDTSELALSQEESPPGTPPARTLARLVRRILDADAGDVPDVLGEIAPYAAALVHTRQNSAGAVIAGLSIAAAAHGTSQAETENLLVEAIQDRNLR